MIIPYYEFRVKKYKTPFWMIYCLLQSCPEYTDPTVVTNSQTYNVQIEKEIEKVWVFLYKFTNSTIYFKNYYNLVWTIMYDFENLWRMSNICNFFVIFWIIAWQIYFEPLFLIILKRESCQNSTVRQCVTSICCFWSILFYPNFSFTASKVHANW